MTHKPNSNQDEQPPAATPPLDPHENQAESDHMRDVDFWDGTGDPLDFYDP